MSINQVESVFQKEEKNTRLNLQIGWDTDLGGAPVQISPLDGKPTKFDVTLFLEIQYCIQAYNPGLST